MPKPRQGATTDRQDRGDGAGAPSPSDLILIAEVGAPFGVRGLCKLRVYTDPVENIKKYPLLDKTGKAFKLRHVQINNKGVTVGFESVANRTEVEQLRNTKLYTPRSALPALEDEDDFYISDLINLMVRDDTGATLGRIRAVQNFGAGDLLDILAPSGISDYLPFTRAFVPTVSISGGYVIIAPPEGFLSGKTEKPPKEETEGEDADGEEG